MEFMQTFYDRFLNGMSPQQALHEAQQTFIARLAWNHPYFWAPFVVVGKE
ncbi:MAG: CHAT domain-containing protein [Magnetococcales bacterium]|nr:CHAT domain-containing protein [Magnetococcales bacterium]